VKTVYFSFMSRYLENGIRNTTKVTTNEYHDQYEVSYALSIGTKVDDLG